MQVKDFEPFGNDRLAFLFDRFPQLGYIDTICGNRQLLCFSGCFRRYLTDTDPRYCRELTQYREFEVQLLLNEVYEEYD